MRGGGVRPRPNVGRYSLRGRLMRGCLLVTRALASRGVGRRTARAGRTVGYVVGRARRCTSSAPLGVVVRPLRLGVTTSSSLVPIPVFHGLGRDRIRAPSRPKVVGSAVVVRPRCRLIA